MPEKQNIQRTKPESKPKKTASNTTFANPSDFGKKSTPVRERMATDLKKKQHATKKK